MDKIFKISNTVNLDTADLRNPLFQNNLNFPDYQEKYKVLNEKIKNEIKNNNQLLMIRINDGELHFLNNNPIGNILKRHYSKMPNEEHLNKLKDNLNYVDHLFTQSRVNERKMFADLLPNKSAENVELIYALFASGDLFQLIKNEKIGIIGSKKKIDIIQKLMNFKEYREYLGLSVINDYFPIPDIKFGDSVHKYKSKLENYLNKTSSNVFLIGAGIAKIELLEEFNKKNGVFIDVGCGITALAGLVNITRPYFGNWINFKLNEAKYNKLDSVDYVYGKNFNEIYLS